MMRIQPDDVEDEVDEEAVDAARALGKLDW
jgi:hypothetical protein